MGAASGQMTGHPFSTFAAFPIFINGNSAWPAGRGPDGGGNPLSLFPSLAVVPPLPQGAGWSQSRSSVRNLTKSAANMYEKTYIFEYPAGGATRIQSR